MKRTITVLQDDIDRSRERLNAGPARFPRSQNCPVAVAAQRELGRGNVAVSASAMVFHGPDMYSVDLPLEAREFVHLFDVSDTAEPFKFEIELPESPA